MIERSRLLWVSLVLACLATASAAQTTVPVRRTISPPPGVQQDEAQADPALRQLLTTLRGRVEQSKLTFTVGYTGALDFPIAQITGLKPPANLLQLAKQQNDTVSGRVQAPSRNACSAEATRFDWRQHDGATPIRDQGPCGSCWAFGTHGAFEGSWRIPSHVALDTSEQDTLSCSGAGSCQGGWWAFDYLVTPGTLDETAVPYTASDSACQSHPKQWKAALWGYVDPTTLLPSPEKIKLALCRYGPLAVAVEVTQPFQAYTGGVFNEHAAGNVNHAVTLIGWDDAKKAWLIKNSWGTAWGETGGAGSERGYMWIARDSNQIGYGAAWVQPAVPAKKAGVSR